MTEIIDTTGMKNLSLGKEPKNTGRLSLFSERPDDKFRNEMEDAIKMMEDEEKKFLSLVEEKNKEQLDEQVNKVADQSDGPNPGVERCAACSQPLSEDMLDVGGSLYHQDCFVCHACGDSLTGRFYQTGGFNYCEKDREAGLESCQACGDLMKEGSVEVGGQMYHHDCFVCSMCQEQILGKFFTTEEGKWLCEACNRDSKPRCELCGLPIMDRMLTALDKKWHPVCFRCSMCDIQLDGVPFMADGEEGKATCRDCFAKHRATQCHRCDKPIVSNVGKRTTLVTCDGNNYHQQCYTCKACSLNLAGQQVFLDGPHIVCGDCKRNSSKQM